MDLSFVAVKLMQVSISTPNISCSDPQTTIDFYETAIANDETIASNYWHLGVAYLLTGREDDAQAAWFAPLATATESEINNLTNDLLAVLERAAKDRAEIADIERAWLLRQHIWMLAPELVDNILHSICLANLIGTLTAASLVEWQVSELLQATSIGRIEEDLLEGVLGALLDIQTDSSLEIIESCLQIAGSRQGLLIGKLMDTLIQIARQRGNSLFIVKIAELCNGLQPDNLDTLPILSYLYSGIDRYPEAKATAEQYYRLAPGIVERVFGSYQIQRAHFKAGNWQGVAARVDLHRQLLAELIAASPQNLDRGQCQTLLASSFFLPYTEDSPRSYKSLQNQLAAIYQQNIQLVSTLLNFAESSALAKQAGCLRIGYIGSTLRKHSVGWLSRWLMHHHDRQSFQIFLYCLSLDPEDTFNHQWFRDKVDITSYFNNSAAEVVAQIWADEIDILIDLDSLTHDLTYLVMAQKPAPVQVSWLGWDSIGIPAVDYFLADPYVLPDDAQDYYQEKIWRLPQTYLAVNGFEVGIPTLRREDLDIPADAVVYLSGQSGYKRHPDCLKAQMQIIKAVPNSYFLIKGLSDTATIQDFFGRLAAEVGISLDRLRFLKQDRDEYTHRANLAIADIVLDTFPYNGATTTLETLWMGIPMVTQVGQQFAARNSYTFMLNAGIEAGIAWNQQEYIEWGIKLGLDRDLRDKIAGKLRSGRSTAPVWNARQFTLEMEQAYRQMWDRYQSQFPSEAIVDYSNN
jgi:predicted O-linked N-acetylglucosamine transferase (SPINDLY family)